MTPIIDVFSAMDAAHAAHLAARVHALAGENARLRAALAAYDQRVDLLQRANEKRESPKFATRKGMVA